MSIIQRVRKKTVSTLRNVLTTAMSAPGATTLAEKISAELNRATTEAGMYGGGYFGKKRNPLDRMGLSGYERYDRDTSNANAIALPIWQFFPTTKTLDVGCATGFVVEALVELGFDAYGTDLSYWAVEHPARGAVGRLIQGDAIKGLPFDDGEFELVTCLEVLEHLPPESIPTVLRELRRVCSGHVVATIPSFGENRYGPGGWFDGKVKPVLLDDYIKNKADFLGPIPPEDLNVDANGEPLEGHICMASFKWWQEMFEAAGFVRAAVTELEMHVPLARYTQTEFWNLYVFAVPNAVSPSHAIRSSHEIQKWEMNFGLDLRETHEGDYIRVNEAREKNGLDIIEIPRDAIPMG